MKFDLKKIIPFTVVLMVFFTLVHFRTVPVSQFWKGWRMLYVYTEELSETDILTVLEKNGCTSVISYGNQRLPVFSQLAPVQVQSSDSYLYRRADFFMDKTHRAKVFYIPENQLSQLESGIRELSAFQGTSAGTDGKSSFPWLAPLISLFLFGVLIYFSRNKILFVCGTIFFLIFAFCRPLFTVCAAVSLYFFAFFIFHRIWGRKDFIKTTLNSPYILLMSLSPILVMLVSSPLNSFFYLLAFVASASLVQGYHLHEEEQNASFSFHPVYIRSSRMIPVVGRLGIRLLGALLISLVLTIFAFRLSGNVSDFSSSASMPSLPAPVSDSESELVQMKDFIVWSWNTVTFPYRKIGEKFPAVPNEGDSVVLTDYQNVNGRIQSVQNSAFVFNSEFRDSVYKAVDNLDYPALEKMMLKQGKNASFGYAKSALSSSSERFGILLLLIFIAIPFTLGIYYILGRKRYGLSI